MDLKKKRNIKKRKRVKRSKKDYTFNLNELLIMTLIALFFGIIVGLIFSYTRNTYLDTSDEGLREIISTYNSISNTYYGKIDKDKLTSGAINGMINILDDPYSSYMDKDTSKDFNDSLNGYYEGIGITISFVDDKCTIIEIFKDSPAEKAGLKVNDVVTKINDINISDYALEEVTKVIGESSDAVKITVNRKGEEKSFKVKKGKVIIQSVESEVIDNTVGYISISNFAANTYDQFRKNLTKLEKKKIKSLVIDLRDNPGGHLNQADKILDMFFPKKKVLYYVKEKDKITKVYAKTKEKRTYPVMVLVNGSSASASEIVASCFQDLYGNAKVIGTKTYGKGTIQKDIKLKSGTSLKYTTERWLTSSGKWLDKSNGGGLNPDIVIEKEDEALNTAVKEAKKSS